MFMGCDGEEICHVEEEDEHSHDGKGHSLFYIWRGRRDRGEWAMVVGCDGGSCQVEGDDPQSR